MMEHIAGNSLCRIGVDHSTDIHRAYSFGLGTVLDTAVVIFHGVACLGRNIFAIVIRGAADGSVKIGGAGTCRVKVPTAEFIADAVIGLIAHAGLAQRAFLRTVGHQPAVAFHGGKRTVSGLLHQEGNGVLVLIIQNDLEVIVIGFCTGSDRRCSTVGAAVGTICNCDTHGLQGVSSGHIPGCTVCIGLPVMSQVREGRQVSFRIVSSGAHSQGLRILHTVNGAETQAKPQCVRIRA